MTVTIHDVARRLHLSITTVSRALDGYDDVAEDTRERVILTAHEMGYVPSRAARQLRRQQAESIGYVLPTTTPRFTDPYFSEFIAGLGDELSGRNFDLLVSTAPPGEVQEKAMYERWVHGRRVDGIILSRIRLRDWRIQYLASEDIPFVTTAHSHDPVDFPFVEVDGQTGMQALVSHLADSGHQRIAYIGAHPMLTLQVERFMGYQQGLAEAGLPFDPALVATGDLTRSGGDAAIRALLQQPRPPTAVACVNDLTAIGVMNAAREMGMEPGRDLAVTGFDGIEDAELVQPPLTTLNQPVYEIARRLMRMALELVAGEPLKEPQVILKPELVIRGSSTGS